MKLTKQERADIFAQGRYTGLGAEGPFSCPYFGDEFLESFDAWLEGYRQGETERNSTLKKQCLGDG